MTCKGIEVSHGSHTEITYMAAKIDEQYETEVDYGYKGKPWNVLIPIAIFAVSVVAMIFIGMTNIQ